MTMDRIKWEPVPMWPLERIQREAVRASTLTESLRLSRSTETTKPTDSMGDAPPADTAQPAVDLAAGPPPADTGTYIPSGQTVPSSTAKMEPYARQDDLNETRKLIRFMLHRMDKLEARIRDLESLSIPQADGDWPRAIPERP